MTDQEVGGRRFDSGPRGGMRPGGSSAVEHPETRDGARNTVVRSRISAGANSSADVRGMVLRCPACSCRIGRGHLPTCEFVRDFEVWFAEAAGLIVPHEGGGLRRWLELVGGDEG